MEIGKIIKCMDMEFYFIQMVKQPMKECGIMINFKGKE